MEQGGDGLVRITLKKGYSDGTVAVDMDPLSLLCRLATSVPPPRFHTVKYAGVLAPASPWRSRLAPQPPQAADAGDKPDRPAHAGSYRPWAELLARTFAVDVRGGVGSVGATAWGDHGVVRSARSSPERKYAQNIAFLILVSAVGIYALYRSRHPPTAARP